MKTSEIEDEQFAALEYKVNSLRRALCDARKREKQYIKRENNSIKRELNMIKREKEQRKLISYLVKRQSKILAKSLKVGQISKFRIL